MLYKLKNGQKNNAAKISDLNNIDFVLKKVKERSSKMFYTRIRNEDNLETIVIGNATYKSDENPIDFHQGGK